MLYGYLFLPDEICATGFYFLGSLLFPLARITGTLLWDRDSLLEMLETLE